jgi:hypothetical protein
MEPSLVRFQHPPSSDSLWSEAGHDVCAFGAALDRLFGETADGHLLEHFTAASDPIVIADDPLVLLANLIDGLSLPMADPVALPMPELAAVYDFGSGADSLNSYDLWVFDSHA